MKVARGVCGGLLAVCLTACGGGGGGSPAASTPASPPPSTPTPAPAPLPTPVPGSTCPIGQGSSSARCVRASPSFLMEVDTAINQLIQQRPDIFDLSEDIGNGNYRVLSVGQYYLGVIANLEKMNFCAAFDGEELQVKNTNDFNDQYHILLSSGHIRRGPSTYRASCYPAAFPLPTTPPPPTAGCPLPGSREIACSRERPNFLAEVEAAINQLAQERPDLFDFKDVQPGTDFFKVVNLDGYIQGMIDILQKKGFCARWDGEELQVKKENRLSDQYDILTADFHIRRGEGAYRATCYPAAF